MLERSWSSTSGDLQVSTSLSGIVGQSSRFQLRPLAVRSALRSRPPTGGDEMAVSTRTLPNGRKCAQSSHAVIFDGVIRRSRSSIRRPKRRVAAGVRPGAVGRELKHPDMRVSHAIEADMAGLNQGLAVQGSTMTRTSGGRPLLRCSTRRTERRGRAHRPPPADL